ncbi:MAG: polysaccharide deacetylase family protein [Pseudonocardia sp.]
MATVGKTLMVLGWHNVEGSWCFPAAPGVGARGLARQLGALRRVTNIVPLGWALRALSDGRPLPSRALAITFDDGYRDNLTLAGPLLRRLNIPATCFLVPGILDGEVVPWWERLAWAFRQNRTDRLEWEGRRWALPDTAAGRGAFRDVSARLKRRDRQDREKSVDELVTLLEPAGAYRAREQFLDWDGARELQKYMEIGSHTMYHCILAQESAQAQDVDLMESRRRLADGLSTDITVLAYPNGMKADYNAATLAAAQRAGYDHAVTTQGGWNTTSTPRFEIRRWVMNPERAELDLAKILRDLARRSRTRQETAAV